MCGQVGASTPSSPLPCACVRAHARPSLQPRARSSRARAGRRSVSEPRTRRSSPAAAVAVATRRLRLRRLGPRLPTGGFARPSAVSGLSRPSPRRPPAPGFDAGSRRWRCRAWTMPSAAPAAPVRRSRTSAWRPSSCATAMVRHGDIGGRQKDAGGGGPVRSGPWERAPPGSAGEGCRGRGRLPGSREKAPRLWSVGEGFTGKREPFGSAREGSAVERAPLGSAARCCLFLQQAGPGSPGTTATGKAR